MRMCSQERLISIQTGVMTEMIAAFQTESLKLVCRPFLGIVQTGFPECGVSLD